MLNIRSLKIWQKLTLIIVATGLVIPIIGALLLADRFQALTLAQKELKGVEYLKPLKKFVEHLPQHRGTANAFLNGNTAVKDRLTTLGALLDDDLKAIEAVDQRLGVELETTATLQKIRKDWRELKEQFAGLPAKESFDRHTKLIADTNGFISLVGDTSGLILDSESDAYYAAFAVTRDLPATAESLGQLRGFGSGIAAKKAIDQDSYGRLAAILGLVRSNVESYQRSFAGASRKNAAVEQSLGGKLRDVTGAISDFTQLAETRLLRAQTIDLDSTQYFDSGTKVIDRVFLIYDDQINLLNSLLADRVSRLRQATWLLVGGVVVAAALAVFLAIYIARTISEQLNAIYAVATEVQRENLSARAAVVNGDELGEVAVSVNRTLDNIVNLINLREKERDERERERDDRQRERDELEDALIKLLIEIRDVAKGDLTVRAEVNAGPTGALADSFNFTLGELRKLIGRINEISSLVNRTADEIQSTTGQLAEGSLKQTDRIVTTSSALKEMTGSITEVSRRAVDSASVAEQSVSKALAGMSAVEKTIVGMNGIREQVQKTAKRIKRLGESSQEVGEIVQLIGDIANQTGILALNASIQAAMAGEAGRGFAVVAEEVERLAVRSSEATKRINSLIKTIQSETAEAVAAMEETTREVVSGSSVATEAGQALNEIQNVSNRLAEIIQEISQDASRQAATSEALANAMTEISGITQENTQGTTRVVRSVDDLTNLASDLRASVSRFKVSKDASVNGETQPAGLALTA